MPAMQAMHRPKAMPRPRQAVHRPKAKPRPMQVMRKPKTVQALQVLQAMRKARAKPRTKPGTRTMGPAAAGAGAGAAAVGIASAAIRRRRRTARHPDRTAPQERTAGARTTRWRVVTVNRPPEEVMGQNGRLPSPLAELGDKIETTVRPAPGGRGTELAACLRRGEPTGLRHVVPRLRGRDARQAVRSALRESKQLLETGEVLSADRPTTTKRTLRGTPVRLATRRAGGEGRL